MRGAINHSSFMLLAGLVPLVFAYISEYGFGLQPCPLCIAQRVIYGVLIALGLSAMLAKHYPKIVFYICIAGILVLLTQIGVAIFHAGVEYEWWEGLKGCTSECGGTIEEIRKCMYEAPVASCSDAPFNFIGLSMAGWNAIYASICTILLTFGLLNGGNKKS